MENVEDMTYFLSNGERKIMRVFVTFGGERVSMDIPFGWTVGKIKRDLVCRRFEGIPSMDNNVQIADRSAPKTVLVLLYAGAELPDHWVLSDLGISPGSTLRARIKSVLEPVLYFYIVYKEETKPVLEDLKLSDLKVSTLRSTASRMIGLPVSIFRMMTPNYYEMFDCHMVDVYDIRPGTVIRIETWDGWGEFLKLSSLGFTEHVVEKLSPPDNEVMRMFQMKVAMYVAAHFGHSDLATRLCKLGARPDEAVGLHPLRQWENKDSRHIDTLKAPIHEAVECNQVDVLRNFALVNITSILARDGHGLQPLNIALRLKMRKCASFLLTKQWSRIPFNNNSIPLVIFHRLKMWADKAKDKVSLMIGVEKSNRIVTRSFPLVGQGTYICGYSSDQMCSRPRAPPRPQQFDPFLERYYAKHFGFSLENAYKSRLSLTLSGKHKVGVSTSDDTVSVNSGRGVKLPNIGDQGGKMTSTNSSDKQTDAVKNLSKKFKTKVKPEDSIVLINKKDDSYFPLPIHSTVDIPKPKCRTLITSRAPISGDDSNQKMAKDIVEETIDNYYQKRGYSPRDHAIECLSITSRLRDKTWLSQVRIAMQISQESVRKSVPAL